MGAENAGEEDILKLLRAGQMLLVRYPVAARAVIRAFVAEGRRYSQTDEGRKLRESLRGSELMRQGRAVWEGASVGLLDDDSEVVLPSMLLEAVMAAAASHRMESLLAQLVAEGADVDSRGG